MTRTPTHRWQKDEKSKDINIILHGSSEGMDSSFMKIVWGEVDRHSKNIIKFNFPYIERPGDKPSKDLKEELDALKEIWEMAETENYETIRLIGKSLGSVVAAIFIEKLPEELQQKIVLVVLGCPVEFFDLGDFKGRVKIIQGVNDIYGDIDKVKAKLSYLEKVEYTEIPDADHSFFSVKVGKNNHQQEAVSNIFP